MDIWNKMLDLILESYCTIPKQSIATYLDFSKATQLTNSDVISAIFEIGVEQIGGLKKLQQTLKPHKAKFKTYRPKQLESKLNNGFVVHDYDDELLKKFEDQLYQTLLNYIAIE